MTHPEKRHTAARLAHLDGLRFFAVLGVILYHYTVRWAPPKNATNLYPFGDLFSHNSVLVFGWLGVELFFLISGFVIAMTLSRCRNILEFAERRYARLGPAMLICSIVTYLVVNAMQPAPFDEQAVWFTSSVLFLDPEDLNRLVPGNVFDSMDGAYWSLYVEVKFYAMASIAYFLAGRRLIPVVGVIAGVGTLANVLELPILRGIATTFFVLPYLPWFVIGIGFYQRYASPESRTGMLTVLYGMALLAVLAISGKTTEPLFSIVGIPLLFWASMNVPTVRRWLSTRIFVMVGAASYSLYLFHQQIGVTLLSKFGPPWDRPGMAVLLLSSMIGLAASIAVISYRYVEKPCSAAILRALGVKDATARGDPAR